MVSAGFNETADCVQFSYDVITAAVTAHSRRETASGVLRLIHGYES